MQHAELFVGVVEVAAPWASLAAIAFALIKSEVDGGVTVGVPRADAVLAVRAFVGFDPVLARQAERAVAEATRSVHRSAQLAEIRLQSRHVTLQRCTETLSEPHQSQVTVPLGSAQLAPAVFVDSAIYATGSAIVSVNDVPEPSSARNRLLASRLCVMTCPPASAKPSPSSTHPSLSAAVLPT